MTTTETIADREAVVDYLTDFNLFTQTNPRYHPTQGEFAQRSVRVFLGASFIDVRDETAGWSARFNMDTPMDLFKHTVDYAVKYSTGN